MHRGLTGLLPTLSLISSLGACALPATESVALDPATAGKTLYRHHCSRCHGFNMVSAGVVPDLRKFPLDEKPRFISTVVDGKGAMPSWKDTLAAPEVEALWGYVNATRPTP